MYNLSIKIPHQSGTFFPSNEPTLKHHYNPKCTVYINLLPHSTLQKNILNIDLSNSVYAPGEANPQYSGCTRSEHSFVPCLSLISLI